MKTTKNSVESANKTPLISALLLLLFGLGAAFAQTNVIFPRQGTVWKYNQTNDVYTETGVTGWTLYDYDDSGPSWQSGPALLSQDTGNGNIAPFIQTVILSPRSPTSPTAGNGTEPSMHARYFRKKFSYADPVAAHTLLRMNHRFDDGAIIWLNGIEIGRKWFNATPAPTHTLLSDCFSCQDPAQPPCTTGGDAECEQVSLFPADALIQGENIIAIALHQTGNNSSDITFGTSLEVILPRAPTIVSNSEPADRFVLEFRSTTLRVYAEASPAPTYQWYYGTSDMGPFTAITDATNSSHTIPSMQLADEGYYYCHVENVLGFADSRKAHVQFSDDPDPPIMLGAMSLNFSNVIVQFNEAMDRVSTGDLYPWTVTDGVTAYTVIGVGFSADDKIVTLTLNANLPEDTLITVIANGVNDVSGNTQDDTRASFRTFVTAGCRSFLFEAFDTSNQLGNAVSILTNHATYPNQPAETYTLPSFDTRHVYPQNLPDPRGRSPENQREQFGGRVRGFFIPPVTDSWVFYLAADDDAQLFVNPSGPDATGKLKVAGQDGIACCQNFMPQGNPRTSAPMSLTAGQAYYVEALYKEGTGGDWAKVAAARASDPTPVGGVSEVGIVSPGVIQGGAGPAGIFNHVTIASHPANQEVRAGQRAAFTVRLSPDVPGCFQWKRNGNDIPGAVGQSYWLSTTMGDDQATFSVAISLMGGTTLASDAATLTVTNDTIAPTITNVTRDVTGNFTVRFDEPVDMSTATNTGNYAIDGTAPGLVTALGNSAVVLVPGVPVNPCPTTHTLLAGGIKDIFDNTMATTSINLTLNDLLILPINDSTSWRYEESGEELGDAWYATGFGDTTWSNGVPVFGFEPSANVMPAGYPIRTTNNWTPIRHTIYYRTHFNLTTDPSTVTNLILYNIIDDGAVFYLNGEELTRIRMNPGPVTTNTQATTTDAEPHPLAVASVPTTKLQFGDNVIAARVHQNLGTTGTSSDVVFGAGLVAQVSGCGAQRPRLSISLSGTQATITSTPPGGTIYSSSDLIGWSSVGAAPQTVTIGPGPLFFEIRP